MIGKERKGKKRDSWWGRRSWLSRGVKRQLIRKAASGTAVVEGPVRIKGLLRKQKNPNLGSASRGKYPGKCPIYILGRKERWKEGRNRK